MTPTTMINDLNNSVEKRTKNMRQKLRAQHRSQIRKMDGDIRARFRTNKLVLAKYHRSELKRLSDLVKKRTELELKILSSIHGLNDAFEAATRELDTAMTMKLV
ncbi:hypothetical protein AJ80_08144 [Polytolypa hystricis UAMH7299]|uniref:Uncharacterized protein n=1 Tax=Polytolypa hystricis (strain UAMH7299) TaxID=1447883 RepID=A0A2B7XCA8_POLH7|nr:hypothetical protein AJ80_08144 [Polytolypa hystricis UAMH7299]